MATSPLKLTTSTNAQLRVLSARLYIFYVGAWVAECILDLANVNQMPSGKVVLTAGGVSFTGTIDPTFSGTFGPSATIRIVAGAGQWDSISQKQHFHSDGQLLDTAIENATAGAIGETTVDPNAQNIGIDYVRVQGPASRVLGDQAWYVDFSGVTQIQARPSNTPDPSLQILDYDAILGKVAFACDSILIPGTPLTDPRFNGVAFVAGDVEQLFDANGSKGETSVTSLTNELLANLKSATLEWTRAAYLTVYRYRLIQYLSGRMALQAVTTTAGTPDLIPITPWGGLAGLTQTLAPSQEVLVTFENADPTLPRVISYGPNGTPLKTVIDATEVDIGPSGIVNLAGGGHFLAFADLVLTELNKIAKTLATGANSGGPVVFSDPYVPPLSVGSVKTQSG